MQLLIGKAHPQEFNSHYFVREYLSQAGKQNPDQTQETEEGNNM